MSRAVSNRIVFILSLLGLGVSVYLTLAHLGQVGMPCTKHGGCELVAEDDFAKGLGIPALKAIPTAAFGALTYLVMAGLSVMRLAGACQTERRAAAAQWLFALLGLAMSGYLTYREAFVIHAWCWMCVTSAIIVTLLAIVTTWERFSDRPGSEPGWTLEGQPGA